MQLKAENVQGQYLFFCAYLQREDEKEMERVNGIFLQFWFSVERRERER